MEKQSEGYAIMGLKALKRATRKAVADARKNNLKIPIWKNGKVVYMVPEIDTEPWAQSDRQTAGRIL